MERPAGRPESSEGVPLPELPQVARFQRSQSVGHRLISHRYTFGSTSHGMASVNEVRTGLDNRGLYGFKGRPSARLSSPSGPLLNASNRAAASHFNQAWKEWPRISAVPGCRGLTRRSEISMCFFRVAVAATVICIYSKAGSGRKDRWVERGTIQTGHGVA
eukprot:scaffold189680_cov19-Prasinocladus_malaysianus.AAC.1